MGNHDLIPADDNHPEPLTSQFANFYRKSCLTEQRRSEVEGLKKIPSRNSKRTRTAINTGTGSHKKRLASTTKAERRRTAQREHELQSQKNKQIQIMLRSLAG